MTVRLLMQPWRRIEGKAVQASRRLVFEIKSSASLHDDAFSWRGPSGLCSLLLAATSHVHNWPFLAQPAHTALPCFWQLYQCEVSRHVSATLPHIRECIENRSGRGRRPTFLRVATTVSCTAFTINITSAPGRRPRLLLSYARHIAITSAMSTDPLQAHATPQPVPAADETIDSAYIDLTILSPSSEVINNGRMNYPKISLDTTIAQLRDRIQNDLPARPSPQQQRLIYRGRPLLLGESTLRQIFRGQVGYTLTFKGVTKISYSNTLPNTLPAIPSIWFSHRTHQRMLLSVACLPRP